MVIYLIGSSTVRVTLPISTITKVFDPRIEPLPNATITELGITELFYHGLLLPNVAHSFETICTPKIFKIEFLKIPSPLKYSIDNFSDFI